MRSLKGLSVSKLCIETRRCAQRSTGELWPLPWRPVAVRGHGSWPACRRTSRFATRLRCAPSPEPLLGPCPLGVPPAHLSARWSGCAPLPCFRPRSKNFTADAIPDNEAPACTLIPRSQVWAALIAHRSVVCRARVWFGKILLDKACRPCGNAGAEKVAVFRPDRAVQCKRARQNGPVIGVARPNACHCRGFHDLVLGRVHCSHHQSKRCQFFKNRLQRVQFAAFVQHGGQVLAYIAERDLPVPER